ncbi:hypothetical protein ADUPG1_012881, partial [Aduncisulcus paluster]
LNLFPPNGFVDNIDIEHVPSVGLKDPALSHFEVDIPDSNLRGLICSDALGDSNLSCTITEFDMATITFDNASNNPLACESECSVTDLEGLQYLINVYGISFINNPISSSLLPLSQLSQLVHIKIEGDADVPVLYDINSSDFHKLHRLRYAIMRGNPKLYDISVFFRNLQMHYLGIANSEESQFNPICRSESDSDYWSYLTQIFPVHYSYEIEASKSQYFLANSCPLNSGTTYSCDASTYPTQCPSIIRNEVYNSVDGVNAKQCAFIAKTSGSVDDGDLKCYTIHDAAIRSYLSGTCLSNTDINNGVISVASLRSSLTCSSLNLSTIETFASLTSVNDISTLQGLEYAQGVTYDGYSDVPVGLTFLNIDGYDLSIYNNENAEYDKLVVQILAKPVSRGSAQTGLTTLSASGCSLNALSDILDLTAPIVSYTVDPPLEIATPSFKLTSLTVSNNNISDVSVFITSNLFNNTILTTLDISGNSICDIDGMVDELETYFTSSSISITSSDQTCHCSASVSSSDHQVCREVYPDRWAVECWNGYYLDKSTRECVEATDSSDIIRCQLCERHSTMMPVLEEGASSITCGCRSAWYGDDCDQLYQVHIPSEDLRKTFCYKILSGYTNCDINEFEIASFKNDFSLILDDSSIVPLVTTLEGLESAIQISSLNINAYETSTETYYNNVSGYPSVQDPDYHNQLSSLDISNISPFISMDILNSEFSNFSRLNYVDISNSGINDISVFYRNVGMQELILNSSIPLCYSENPSDYRQFIHDVFPKHDQNADSDALSKYYNTICPIDSTHLQIPSIIKNEIYDSTKQCASIALDGGDGKCYTIHDTNIRNYLYDSWISNHDISSYTFNSVADLRRLTEDDFDFFFLYDVTNVSDITSLRGLEYLRCLKFLDVSGYDLSSKPDDREVIKLLSKYVQIDTFESGLTRLYAENCSINRVEDILDITPISYDSYTQPFRLTTIILKDNNITDISMFMDTSLFNTSSMSLLDLSGSNRICDIPHVSTLLGTSGISSFSLPDASPLPCPCTESVDFSAYETCRYKLGDREHAQVECWYGYYFDREYDECHKACGTNYVWDGSSCTPDNAYPDNITRTRVCERRNTLQMAILEENATGVTCGCKNPQYIGDMCNYVYIPDDNLRAAVCEALHRPSYCNDLLANDMERVTSLTVDNVATFDGLSFASNLESLSVTRTDSSLSVSMSDVEISYIPTSSLVELALNNMNVPVNTSFAAFSVLEKLTLQYNTSYNVSSSGTFHSSLKYLDVTGCTGINYGNFFTSYNVLSDTVTLNSIEILVLDNTNLTDFAGFSQWITTHLSIAYTGITSISPLLNQSTPLGYNNSTLTHLNIDGLDSSVLSNVKYFPNLEYLSARNMNPKITDSDLLNIAQCISSQDTSSCGFCSSSETAGDGTDDPVIHCSDTSSAASLSSNTICREVWDWTETVEADDGSGGVTTTTTSHEQWSVECNLYSYKVDNEDGSSSCVSYFGAGSIPSLSDSTSCISTTYDSGEYMHSECSTNDNVIACIDDWYMNDDNKCVEYSTSCISTTYDSGEYMHSECSTNDNVIACIDDWYMNDDNKCVECPYTSNGICNNDINNVGNGTACDYETHTCSCFEDNCGDLCQYVNLDATLKQYICDNSSSYGVTCTDGEITVANLGQLSGDLDLSELTTMTSIYGMNYIKGGVSKLILPKKEASAERIICDFSKFENMLDLTYLDVSGCDMSTEESVLSLSSLHSLPIETLIMNNVNISANFIPNFSEFSSLKSLSIGSNENYNATSYTDFPSSSPFVSLDISGSKNFDIENVPTIIRNLYADSCELDTNESFSHLTNLQILSLSDNANFDIRNLVIAGLTNLTTLNVSGCNISDPSPLYALSSNSSWISLDLSKNNICVIDTSSDTQDFFDNMFSSVDIASQTCTCSTDLLGSTPIRLNRVCNETKPESGLRYVVCASNSYVSYYSAQNFVCTTLTSPNSDKNCSGGCEYGYECRYTGAEEIDGTYYSTGACQKVIVDEVLHEVVFDLFEEDDKILHCDTTNHLFSVASLKTLVSSHISDYLYDPKLSYNVSSSPISYLSGIEHLVGIKYIEFIGSLASDVTHVANFASLTNLVFLNFSDNSDLSDMPDLLSLTSLEYLNLSNTSVTFPTDKCVLPSSIVHLSIENTNVTTDGFERNVTYDGGYLSALEILTFGGNDLIISINELSETQRNTLKELEISETDLGDNYLDTIATMTNLSLLSLIDCNLSRIPDLSNSSLTLLKLDVSSNESVSSLIPIGKAGLTNLQSFSASGCHISDPSPLYPLSSNTSWNNLELSDNMICGTDENDADSVLGNMFPGNVNVLEQSCECSTSMPSLSVNKVCIETIPFSGTWYVVCASDSYASYTSSSDFICTRQSSSSSSCSGGCEYGYECRYDSDSDLSSCQQVIVDESLHACVADMFVNSDGNADYEHRTEPIDDDSNHIPSLFSVASLKTLISSPSLSTGEYSHLLTCNGSSVSDISGVEHIGGVAGFYLGNNLISDTSNLTLLSTLTQLKILDLSGNSSISSLPALSNVPLIALNIDDTDIELYNTSDQDFLLPGSLVQLRMYNTPTIQAGFDTQVGSSNLGGLKTISIGNTTSITSIDSLSTSLETLYIADTTSISDLQPTLNSMSSLHSVKFDNIGLSSIPDFSASSAHLTFIDLSNNG